MNKYAKSIIVVLLFVFLVPNIVLAQDDIKSGKIIGADSAISTPFFAGAAGWTFPFGEMGNRYKSFFNLNANLGWKTKSNWLYVLDFAFQFGANNVKNMDNILSTLMTNDQN